MILIVSNNDDWSTNDVVEWLEHYKAPYKRINYDDVGRTISYSVESNSITTSTFDLDQVSITWFRRTTKVNYNQLVNGFTDIFNRKLLEFADLESKYFNRGFFHLINFKCSKWLNNFFSSFNDKIETLLLAKKFGISVPDFLITQSKCEAVNFINNNIDAVITKPIYNIGTIRINNKVFMPYTRLICEEDLNSFDEHIFPIFLQKKINKKIEIRSFYLDGQFFSMAIFSQTSSKTNIDFRNYDRQKPNRRVPYKLPEYLEIQLTNLMESLKLNSGSIDLIVTPDDKYYFLEVNPVGQFGMVSYPCNYSLEEKIATFLINSK